MKLMNLTIKKKPVLHTYYITIASVFIMRHFALDISASTIENKDKCILFKYIKLLWSC